MPYLLVSNPDTTEEKNHPLKLGKNRIGRSPDNDVVVIHGSLSRHHAELTINEEQYTITDLNSLNGTSVHGIRINQIDLQDGDSLTCGNVPFRFVAQLEAVVKPEPIEQNQEEQEPPLSIVKQIAPQESRIVMNDILERDNQGRSVLKIREQSTEQRAVDKLKILLEVSKELACPNNSDTLLEKILELLLEIMSVDRAAILMLDRDTWELECKAFRLREGIFQTESFYSSKITKYVCQHSKAILTDNASYDQRFGSHSVISQAIQAAMCVPLMPEAEVIGVLYVDSLSLSNVFTEEDLEFLTALANQASVAIENARLYRQMRAEAGRRNKLEQFFPPAVSKQIQEQGNLEIVEREVTVIFCDISGFTKMSSTMEPRAIIAMLNDYFQVMVEDIVFCYEGTLEKYIGDALLAVWGAPYPQEDQVERALKAAVDMQRAVIRLNAEWMEQGRKPINIHIGINHGKVAAGNIGSDRLIQYATIGDTTNVTSRICNVAQAGEIVVSQSTHENIRQGNFPFEKMQPVMVKGKDQPLQLYRLLWQEVEFSSVSCGESSDN